ncbi:ChaN family lipoprotein [Undibacterium fentianense]|uniref:ChaN family lipoprotein n=1 Tax=Undibacterium fentianense TaxID=2828728 RepID=A0A941DXR8_9BURK|nr:ChaN family lipoprotein [Undibacterium fentianense]MBR7798685.1 ChaN family lipoprotein [Undibacterium fentianense]
MRLVILIFGILISWSAQAFQQSIDHPLIGTVLNTRNEIVSEKDAFDTVRKTEYVFVGEKHDNPDHHALELRLIHERFRVEFPVQQGGVVFEMLDQSHTAAIAERDRRDSLDQLRFGLKWPEKGSWDWASYGPLFHAALGYSALVAGNIDRAFISEVYKTGQSALDGKDRFVTAIHPPSALRDYLLDQIHQSHCGMQSRETLLPMLHIQLAKDASMASAMLQTKAAMLIAGGEHVKLDSGAPWHLLKKKPDAKILIVQLVEVTSEKTNINDYAEIARKADLTWLTKATEMKDYCAGVKGKAAQ